MRTNCEKSRDVYSADGSTKTSIQEKQVTEEHRCQEEKRKMRSWYAGARVLTETDMPIEMAYRAAMLKPDEAKLFFLIYQAMADRSEADKLNDEPLLLIPDEIEFYTGLTAKQQQRARASLMLRDMIRCKDEGNGWIYCYITRGSI